MKNARIERYPPSSTIASAKRPISVMSLNACAVQSTGLRGAANGSIAFSRACVASGIAGSGSPTASAASEISTPAPPLIVITPSVLPAG